jgi:hypothetical protein
MASMAFTKEGLQAPELRTGMWFLWELEAGKNIIKSR